MIHAATALAVEQADALHVEVKGDRPIGFDRGATLGAHDEEVVADAHMNQRLAAQRFDQLDQAIDRLRALRGCRRMSSGRTPKVNCSVPLIASRAAGGRKASRCRRGSPRSHRRSKPPSRASGSSAASP